MLNWKLLSKYFSDECTDIEKRKLNLWINRKKKNKKLFHQLSETLFILDNYTPFKTFDTDKAWNKLNKKIIDISPAYSKKHYFFPKSKSFYYGIAASILFIIGLYFGFRFFIPDRNKNYISVISKDKGFYIILPDSSKAYLNKLTEIKYSADFNKLREVTVKGTVFFEVVNHNNTPFIVKADYTNIKVLGTSFMVKTIDKHQVEVYVETGKVMFSQIQSGNNGITLMPGFLGSFKDNKITATLNNNKNIIAWKTKKMIFDNTCLSEVINIIEDVYGIDIELKSHDIEYCRFTSTGVIENQPLENVLDIISAAFNLEVNKTNDKIILSGKGCNQNDIKQ
jgi:ferric-dicitrate binding protein FerR (iron transport regulator)